MDHYNNYQELQTLLKDPKFKPYVELAKKILFYSSQYLILLLQTIHAFVSKHPQISEWIGYCFSIYMAYLTVRRTIRLVKSSLYLIVLVLCLWIWQRGASQTILMDIPYFVEQLRQYLQVIRTERTSASHFTFSEPLLEIYEAMRSFL